MITDAIKAGISADQPLLLWGAPGAGKSAVLHALAKDEDAECTVLLGSTLDPSEIGGIPYVAHGGLERSAPPWARRMHEALRAGRKAWLFLDELSCSPPSAQAALLRLVYDRQAGDCDLRGCRVVGAANPSDSAADGGWLSPSMSSRWLHLDFIPDPTQWATGEMSGWGAQATAAASLVASWIVRSPGALAPAIPPDKAADLRGWPCPRSWSALARTLSAIGGDPRTALLSLAGQRVAAGLVGTGAAAEILAWATALDLPDPEALLSGSAKLPSRGDQVSAALIAVVHAACSNRADRHERLGMAAEVIGMARADAAVVAARALTSAYGDLPLPKVLLTLAAKIGRAQ